MAHLRADAESAQRDATEQSSTCDAKHAQLAAALAEAKSPRGAGGGAAHARSMSMDHLPPAHSFRAVVGHRAPNVG